LDEGIRAEEERAQRARRSGFALLRTGSFYFALTYVRSGNGHSSVVVTLE
jgi:hypothetical protein